MRLAGRQFDMPDLDERAKVVFTKCISHVPVGLDVVRRQRDLADVAELRAVHVGQGVADVAADRGKLLLP
jgi:hypothetical protein